MVIARACRLFPPFRQCDTTNALPGITAVLALACPTELDPAGTPSTATFCPRIWPQKGCHSAQGRRRVLQALLARVRCCVRRRSRCVVVRKRLRGRALQAARRYSCRTRAICAGCCRHSVDARSPASRWSISCSWANADHSSSANRPRARCARPP